MDKNTIREERGTFQITEVVVEEKTNALMRGTSS
jgi:hypothetical protein